MVGYVGRWRLYETALQIQPALLAVFVLSSSLALIAYVLALTRMWWGPEEGRGRAEGVRTKEPLLLQIALVALVVMLLVPGTWPGMLLLLTGGRP